MSALDDLRAAIGFLTPLGGSSPSPSPTTMAWFPVVGAAVGCAIGNVWRWSWGRLAPFPAAVVAVTADCVVTGGLHLDGLADTADGLFAHAPARARLDIMAEPQIGTFAALALGLALLGRTAALSALRPSPTLLTALYCASRSVMVIASRALPYARTEGLASAFLPTGTAELDRAFQAAALGAAAALVLARATAGRSGAAAVLAGWAGAAGVFGLARRGLGGFTGDVLGAAGAVSETVALLVAAASRPSREPAGKPARAAVK